MSHYTETEIKASVLCISQLVEEACRQSNLAS